MTNDIAADVVIYGGGVAGAMLAKQLAGHIRAVIVDPLDYFEVPMAAPRNLVEPTYAEKSVWPFSVGLPSVRHIRGKLVILTPDGGIIEDANGNRMLVNAKVSVLATGSRFANELMRSVGGTAPERRDFYLRFNARLGAAQRVLIVGGGPIGVEVTGEISQTWPGKTITLIEAGPRLLAGTSAKAADYAKSVLAARNVTIIVDDKIENDDKRPTDSVFADGGKVVTSRGRTITYDILLWCIGGRPNTAYMQNHFASALNEAGRIKVTPDLRVVGQDRLFALGDITDLAENKMAIHIGGQLKVASANVRARLAGSPKKLKSYKAQTGNPMMIITLGRPQGVAHLPLFGVVRSSWISRKTKGEHMLVPHFRKVFGLS